MSQYNTSKNTNKMLAFVIATLALTALTAVFQNKTTSRESAEYQIQDDLVELSSTGVSRATEVGKANPATKGNGKEVIIALDLTDPALSQKYDLNLTSWQMAMNKHNVMGSKSEKACIIDTGIDVNHPDIKNNLWVNPGEACESKTKKGEYVVCAKSSNGIDDDG
ncbi:MAG: hypothetical protein AABZ31_10140, partial [Bdellovibrionota bacterium]